MRYRFQSQQKTVEMLQIDESSKGKTWGKKDVNKGDQTHSCF